MSVPWYLMAKGKGGGGYKTASGPIVSVNDALAAPLRSLVANIDPVQDLHGYESPWPAGGGKNLWDEEWIVEGTAIASKNRIPCEAGQWYYISVAPANGLRFYDAENNIIETVYTNYKQAPTGAVTMWFKLGSAYGTTYKNDVIVAKTTGSGVSVPYSPYSNICPISGWSAANVWVKPTYDPTADPTATLQLGQTIYGGTLDLLTGVLTVDKGFVEYDGSNDETWYSYDPDNYDSLCFIPPPIVNKEIGNSLSICNRFANVLVAWGAGGDGKYGVFSDHTTLARFYFRQPNANVSTIPQWKAWLGENPVTVVYPLATPTTIPLTPTQISTLQGQNNVWADSGDVTVEYLSAGGADPDLMKLAVAFMGRR